MRYVSLCGHSYSTPRGVHFLPLGWRNLGGYTLGKGGTLCSTPLYYHPDPVITQILLEVVFGLASLDSEHY